MPERKDAGVPATAFFGFLGLFWPDFHGWVRTAVIVIACLGMAVFLVLWMSRSKLIRYWFRRWRHHYRMNHYYPNVGHMDIAGNENTPMATQTYVYATIYHGSARGQYDYGSANPILELPNLRCEFRRPWHRKKYLCTGIRGTGSAIVRADIPIDLLGEVSGRVRLKTGSYIMSWKCDSRWRSLARLWVGFDETGYKPHPIKRLPQWWQNQMALLDNEAEWPEL